MKALRQPMTPKERRADQHAREAKLRSETEADIAGFKSGRTVARTTELTSTEKSKKTARRCFGCDATGARLEVWEYRDVASGPSILCRECSDVAEASYAKKQKALAAKRPSQPVVRKTVRTR